jgi:hypothetical protein
VYEYVEIMIFRIENSLDLILLISVFC